MAIILQTKNLTKKFKNTIALDGVNLTINRGDIYGFIGENGAGKSTFFKTVTNIIIPTSGQYEVNLKKEKGKIAAIIENPAIHGSLSALDNLRFQNTLLNLNKSDDQLKKLLRIVGLANLINDKKKAKNFSLGMKQRLSIASALISDPELILLDEPMNGLDPLGIKHMRDLILKLNQEQGITFMVSSHILLELDKIATTYGFISHGKLLKEINAKELNQLTSPYVEVTFKKEIGQDLLQYLNKYDYDLISKNIINIKNNIDQSILIKELSDLGFELLSIIKNHKGLENYYVEIIGDNND